MKPTKLKTKTCGCEYCQLASFDHKKRCKRRARETTVYVNWRDGRRLARRKMVQHRMQPRKEMVLPHVVVTLHPQQERSDRCVLRVVRMGKKSSATAKMSTLEVREED